MLRSLPDGRIAVKLGDEDDDCNNLATLVKSDGSTLYLLRDLLAAIHRIYLYNPDRMLYVVENGQAAHFAALFAVCERLSSGSSSLLSHVKFGRVSGMSSRKGTAVLLRDILDEAAARTQRQREESPNTREGEERVADVLGVTAVAINDMKQRRKAGLAPSSLPLCLIATLFQKHFFEQIRVQLGEGRSVHGRLWRGPPIHPLQVR